MEIDKKTYKLKSTNYHKKIFDKHQIVIGNSFANKLDHVEGWKNRMGGEYTKTSTFTIDRKGNIYQHYDPKYYSDYIDIKKVDKKIISISLENIGWLIKDMIKDKYIDWVGNIYKRRAKVIEQRWRGFSYWDPYTTQQVKSCLNLVKFLCEENNIPLRCVGHNTFIEEIALFDGISYKSNYFREATDLSPAWNFKKFKNKIEEKNKQHEPA